MKCQRSELQRYREVDNAHVVVVRVTQMTSRPSGSLRAPPGAVLRQPNRHASKPQTTARLLAAMFIIPLRSAVMERTVAGMGMFWAQVDE
jgi:uncharacterized membrane protein